MKTFTERKEFVENPHYQVQRQTVLCGLTDDLIDVPMIDLINGFNKLSYCFTLQSCYGHFSCNGQKDAHNIESLPVKDSIDKVEYRIAYIVFCIEDCALGRGLFEALKGIEAINPDKIQFFSAEWFWERQVNSFALQVEPDRFKREDKVILDYEEALHIEVIRNDFFVGLNELLDLCQRGRLLPS